MLNHFKNRRTRRTLISFIAAAAVMLAALTPIYLSGETQKGEQLETPEKVYFGAIDKTKTENDLADYYLVSTVNGVNTYTRTNKNTASGTWNWKNRVPVIYGGSYTNFSMEFDYKFSADVSGRQQVWLLMGVSDKAAFSTADGTAAIAIGAGGYTEGTACNINYIGKSSKSILSNTTYDGTAKHHAKIVMLDGTVTVTVDNSIVASQMLDVEYNGGYIGIGTGQKSVEISDVTVSDSVSDNFAYFGSVTGSKSSVEPENYYDITEKDGIISYLRNNNSNSTWHDGTPFLSIGNYKNFTLEYDFKYTGSGERYVWLNIGNKKKNAFDHSTGSIQLCTGMRNAASDDTRINGFYEDAAGLGWFDGGGWLDTNGAGSPMDGTALHHVKITVNDGIITIDIDNGACYKRRALSSAYDGGYVMIGSNYADTLISGISVMDIDKTGNYSFYATEDINTVGMTSVKMNDYYTINGATLTRNSNTDGKSELMALFSDNIFYTDLSADLKLTFPNTIVGESSTAYITIGAINCYDSLDALKDTGAVQLAIRRTVTETSNTIAFYYDCGSGGTWSEETVLDAMLTEPYSFKITVSGKNLIIKLGEENTVFENKLPSKYAGGLVFFGTSDAELAFSDVKATSTAAPQENFASYFSPELTASGTFDTAEFSDYWNVEGGMVVRNSNSNADSHTTNMAVLYLDTRKYNNFELTMRYKPVGMRGAYVGFGAEMGKSWWADVKDPAERAWEIDKGNNVVYLINSGAVEAGPTSSYINGSSPDNWWYDTWLVQAGELFKTTEQKNGIHTVRIRVENGNMTVWIDDYAQGSLKMAEYKSGYIYIAASLAGASFSVPSIIDFDNEPEYDFSAYNSYYAEDVSKGLTAVDANDYWRINSNGNLERRPTTVIKSDTGSTDRYDMAYLLLKDTNYKSFTIDLDYKHGTTNWRRFFIGFGAEDGKSWWEENGGAAFTIMEQGVAEYNGNIVKNGQYAQSIFWPFQDEDGNVHQQVPNYNAAAWHHLHMDFTLGVCIVTIDDYEWEFDCTLPADFTTGNIFIAANSSSAEFKNITVVDTSNLYVEDSSPGWEPTDEDVYFDFSKRVKKSKSIHKYTPTKNIY